MKRRIIAVLAALALGSTVVIGTSSAAVAAPDGAPYVALGDSEAAGTGNLPYVDEVCKRSKKAYPAVLAGMIGAPVVSAACSGATTADVAGPGGQLQQLVATGMIGPATQLVTVTVGINDLDWQNLLLACASDPASPECHAAAGPAGEALGDLPARIVGVLGAIRQAASAAQIVITGYPPLFGQVTTPCSIGALDGTPMKVRAEYALEVNVALGLINSLVSDAVDFYSEEFGDPGVKFVDVTTEFAGHALCDTGDRWISGLVSGKKTADRGLHPNTAGQQAFARAIAGTLAG